MVCARPFVSRPLAGASMDGALQVTWQSGWESATDDKSGKTYYFNRHTGIRQWCHPSDDECVETSITSETTTAPAPQAQISAAQPKLVLWRHVVLLSILVSQGIPMIW